MKNLILNLRNPSDSDIDFRINKFPDGQRSVTLINVGNILYKKVKVVIASSICSFSDWELVLSAVSALKSYTNNYVFYCPYLLGARSDRKFEEGGDFYFDEVTSKMVKLLNCPIVTLDLHCKSDTIIQVNSFIKTKIPILNYCPGSVIIYPDESSKNRNSIFSVYPSFTFIKERSDDKIIQYIKNTTLDKNLITKSNNLFIVDDLFDGGASFVGLCESLISEYNVKGYINIVITHFIGSNQKNLDKLKEMGVKIHTTNSYINENYKNENKNVYYTDVFSNNYIDLIVNKSFFE